MGDREKGGNREGAAGAQSIYEASTRYAVGFVVQETARGIRSIGR